MQKRLTMIIVVAVLAITLACVSVAPYIIAALTASTAVSSSGTVVAGPNVGVYTSSACTTAVTSISWGTFEVNSNTGASASQTVYVEDTGGVQMAPSINVSNWSPSSAGSYVTITWSTLPSEIQPGVSGAVAVTLTCTVAAGAPAASFSNTITFSGTG